MKLTSHGTSALLVLILSISIAACGSDETTGPVSPERTKETSPSRSEVQPEPPASSQEPAITNAAEAFTAYAEASRSGVPWADTVRYRLSGEQLARFDAISADRRETWDGCPRDMVTYEGRDCPISPLTTIALASHDRGAIVYETTAPTSIGCNRYQAGAEKASTIWIRPDDKHRDCFSDFAVAVSLDRSGRVASVDMTLSGP